MAEQGTEYAAFVSERLAVERDRHIRLNAGSTATTSTSAGVVALLVALSALILGKDFHVNGLAKVLVVAALVSLGAATILAVVSGLMRSYTVPDNRTLRSCLDGRWTDTSATAKLTVAWLDLDTLLSLRNVNNKKSWWLDVALKTQLGGVVTIVIATITQVVVSF